MRVYNFENGRLSHRKRLYNFPSKTDLIYGYIIMVSLCTLYKYIGCPGSFRAHELHALVQLE